MKKNYWQAFEEGNFYHIYNHASGNKNIFISDKDYFDFLMKYIKYLSGIFETLAFCLMPNHFHFLVKVKSYEEILKYSQRVVSNKSDSFQRGETDINSFILDQFRKYFSAFALSYNHRNNNKGQLFLKRFKRVSFDPDIKLRYMICYLHHNPIHHGFVKNYNQWKYSSYLLCRHNKKLLISDRIELEVSGSNYFGDGHEFDAVHHEFKINIKEDINLE